ncbi:MAG: zinc-dependent alcohol dehydrogenase [Longibaculum sp.]
MRGGKYNGVRNVELSEFDKPVLRENTLLIKNMRAGICGTDLHAYTLEGESVGILPGNQFGHEMCGVIDSIGSGVEGFEVGERVFVNPVTFRAVPNGYTPTMSADMAGAFSEYVLVENPTWDLNLFKIPNDVSLEYGALIEPLSVSMNGVMLANPKKGQKAIVYGAGTIGLGCLVALKHLGIEDVIVADSVPLRLEAVKKLGGIPCDITKTKTNDFALELWGNLTIGMGMDMNNADLVFDCAGYTGSIRDYLDCAKIGSKLVCIALGNGQVPISTSELAFKSVSIMGSCGYSPEANKEVIHMLDSHIDLSPMITAVYPLSNISYAFEDASDASKNIKVIIDHTK